MGDWDLEDPEKTGSPDPEPEALIRCDKCFEEIRPGDFYYDVDGDIYCERCMMKFTSGRKVAPPYLRDFFTEALDEAVNDEFRKVL